LLRYVLQIVAATAQHECIHTHTSNMWAVLSKPIIHDISNAVAQKELNYGRMKVAKCGPNHQLISTSDRKKKKDIIRYLVSCVIGRTPRSGKAILQGTLTQTSPRV